VDDMTEMSASESGGAKSVLHVLEFRRSRNFERIMRVLTQEYGTPIVNLDSFDLQINAASALPLDFMTQRGAAVFEFIGTEPLVVVMNPVSPQLKEEVQSALGAKSHFFIAQPSDFDRMLVRVSDLLEQQAEGAHAPAGD